MKLLLPFLLTAVSVLFYSCTSSTKEVETTKTSTISGYSAGFIDEDLQKEIQCLNQDIIHYASNNELDSLKNLMSEACLDSENQDFDTELSNSIIRYINSDKYEILTEYYFDASELGLTANFTDNIKNDTSNFTFSYKTATKESYLTLMVQKTGNSEMLITTLFAKRNNEWLLDGIKVSNLTLYGKTCPELYYDSKKHRENGNFLAAMHSMMLSQITQHPAMNLLTYEKSEEIEEYNNLLTQELKDKYIFPIEIPYLKSKIEGMRMEHTTDLQFFPMLLISTSTDIHSKKSMEAEGNKIISKLEEILPSYTEGFSHVFLTFYNELPDEGQDLDSYSLLLKVP